MTNKEVKTKQLVQYVGKAEICVWPYSPENKPVYVARIPLVLNHPSLGRERDIRSSRIVKHPDETGRFETVNTIYEKVESEENYGNE
jgi:hypothetical protein